MNNPIIFALICLACIVVGILAHKYVPGTSAKAIEQKVEAIAGAAVADIRAAAPKVDAVFAEVKDAAETEALALLSKGVAWLVDTSAEDTAIADANAVIQAAVAAKAHKAALLGQHQTSIAALKVA